MKPGDHGDFLMRAPVPTPDTPHMTDRGLIVNRPDLMADRFTFADGSFTPLGAMPDGPGGALNPALVDWERVQQRVRATLPEPYDSPEEAPGVRDELRRIAGIVRHDFETMPPLAEDVYTVVRNTCCTSLEAEKALRENHNDVVNAIISLCH